MNGWHLNLGALMSVLWVLGDVQPIAAQVVPDTTLPAGERSQVTGNSNFQIDGGARRGSNLFHSFQSFSIPTGGSAYFNNAANVQNILTRVTGGSLSNIDGLIRANGTANLFLLNPSGIIFGNNASLSIGGSFVATTANAIGFGNLGFFSALNPEVPSPLLTINPSALFFNQIAASPIQNSSTAPAGSTLAGEEAFGLRVPDGRSLLLVGGNISMDGGQANAFGGRIELGGFSGVGTVGLNEDGNNLSLSFPNGGERSDVFLSNGAQVNVFAGNGGNIAVNARNLEMTGLSGLTAGIESGLSSNNGQAGNISVNATGVISLDHSSIANVVQSDSKGQGGDVNISASTLQVLSGGQVYAITYSVGKGGNLTVNAQNVQIIGGDADNPIGDPSGLFAATEYPSTGDAGNLTIKTDALLVRDGAQVGSGTRSAGKGGSLTVEARDVQLIGTSADNQIPSGLIAAAEYPSTGDAGNLTIKTNTLLVRDGAQVISGTRGAGKGGSLTIEARDVQLIGTNADHLFSSGLFTTAQLTGNPTGQRRDSTGNAGDLTVKTNTLVVRDGAQISAETATSGKGGNVTIETDTLLVQDGAQVTT